MPARAEPERRAGRWARVLVVTAAFAIVVRAVHEAQSALVFLLVAGFFAMLATPPVLWLERKGVPSAAAALLVVAGMVVLLVVLGGSVGASLSGFYEEAPAYQARLDIELLNLRRFFSAHGVKGADKVLLGYFDPAAVLRFTGTMLASLGSALSDLFIVVLTITFTLLEASSFPVKLRAVLGDPRQAFPGVSRLVSDLERYVLIKTLVSAATGVLVGGWLAILGVDFAIVWGFLAFLLNYVPNVGPILAAVPAALLAYVQHGALCAAEAAAGFMAVHLVLGYGVETKLMGRRLHLSTLVVFLSLMLWGSLLGPVGMVLCIPLTMAVRFACESDPETQWIAVLLGPEVPEEAVPPAPSEVRVAS